MIESESPPHRAGRGDLPAIGGVGVPSPARKALQPTLADGPNPRAAAVIGQRCQKAFILSGYWPLVRRKTGSAASGLHLYEVVPRHDRLQASAVYSARLSWPAPLFFLARPRMEGQIDTVQSRKFCQSLVFELAYCFSFSNINP